MLETVVASAVFAMVGVGVITGLSVVNLSGARTDEQSVAENIARNQMEDLFQWSYREPDQTPYPTVTLPTGYTVAATASHVAGSTDPEVELVGVTVFRDSTTILSVEAARFRNDGMQLRVSYNDDRSDSVRLQDETLAGDVYVFLDDPDFRVDTPVSFYLDGVFVRTENCVHWDFGGSAGCDATDPAQPWDTATAAPGDHTILAEAVLNNGETVNVTADFIISN